MTRDEKDLQAGINRMQYEWTQLVAARNLVAEYQRKQNAALESYALHTRNILDFCQIRSKRESNKNDDIKISDFTHDETSAKKAAEDLAQEWEEDRKRINKKALHPSYEGTDLDDGWDLDKMTLQLVRDWEKVTKFADDPWRTTLKTMPGGPGRHLGSLTTSTAATTTSPPQVLPFMLDTGEDPESADQSAPPDSSQPAEGLFRRFLRRMAR